MENPAPFDLNQAIASWRQNLAASPAFSADNLDELAAHLRDSVNALVAKGLSEEEAWCVAQRRTGNADSLNREFGVINAESLWFERVIWMVAGFVLIGWFGLVASTVRDLAVATAFAFETSPQLRGLLQIAAYPIAQAGLLIFLWTRVIKRIGDVSDKRRWLRAHPFAAGIGILLIGAMANALRGGSLVLLLKFVPPTEMGSHVKWSTSFGIFNLILWPAILTFLLWRRSRARKSTA